MQPIPHRAKAKRARLKTRASRLFMTTDKVTQEDVQSMTGRLTSLGSLAEVIDEQEPEQEPEPEPHSSGSSTDESDGDE
eukprot:COSAG06_NODE_3828_length_4861_cov_4.239605_5_plen_79_part_00